MKTKTAEKAAEKILAILKAGRPESGKIYALTGAPGTKNIANGNTWAESEVIEETGKYADRRNALPKEVK